MFAQFIIVVIFKHVTTFLLLPDVNDVAAQVRSGMELTLTDPAPQIIATSYLPHVGGV